MMGKIQVAGSELMENVRPARAIAAGGGVSRSIPLPRKAVVLIVDDSAAVRREVRDALECAGDIDSIHERADGIAALQAMAELKPDLVVCDLVMPGCDGTTFLRLRAAKPELAAIPVLMLTSADDQDRKVEILERGAADFITKPFHARELLARVRIHYRMKILQDELYAYSCTDSLTGLFNRRHLDRMLEVEVSRHHRYGVALSVILLDIDHFKSVNDDYGHATGDAVLRATAGTVKSMTRKPDIVARYGGEEICLVLASTPLAGATILAERLREAVAELAHPTPTGRELRATISLGVASADGSDRTVTPERLLARADDALYRAKRGGRNAVVAWQPPFNGS